MLHCQQHPGASRLAFLSIAGLTVSYGGKADVLRDVSLEVERGEVVGLIGPSGSGKSTILRTLVGLMKPKAGRVSVDGAPVDYASRGSLRAARDRFAIVFQQYNLFQNMTALRNVAIAPTLVKKRDRGQVEAEARALLARVGLAEKVNAYPDELSGGQQQRVAIARALALKPDILLLDEVTAALDPELVGEVLDTIRALQRDGMTMLIVSHEMGFIREVASRVAFLDQGSVVEVGPPADIFDRPTSPRLRDFTSRILRH
jgi:polar amino acid transport system ATP-binding protein